MKKNYFFTVSLIISLSFASLGQELLSNGNFENWDTDTAPASWTKVEQTTKETTHIHGGSFSAKHVGGRSDLGQTIAGIVAGNSYTIKIWYKVVVNDGTDSRIWSYWQDASNNNVTDSATDAALRGPGNSYLDNNGGAWTTYEATVIAPVGATQFYFELRTYSGAITYWDDLSFVNNTSASVKDNTIEGFTTYPNPIDNKRVTVSTAENAKKLVKIYNILGKQVFSHSFTGTSKTFDVSSISAGIYILKVIEGTKIATKKLVIR